MSAPLWRYEPLTGGGPKPAAPAQQLRMFTEKIGPPLAAARGTMSPVRRVSKVMMGTAIALAAVAGGSRLLSSLGSDASTLVGRVWIGGVAEAATISGCVVTRIDRAMAEQAVASGRRIIVLAALQSTCQPTVALLRRIASDAKRAIDVVEVMCERAWRLFEMGDHPRYAADIARVIEATALPRDLELLVHASMAPAAELVRKLGVPVLSSPRLGVEAAVSRYRLETRLADF